MNTSISTYNHPNLNAIVQIEPKVAIPPLLKKRWNLKLARG
jgi:hypothetical protein